MNPGRPAAPLVALLVALPVLPLAASLPSHPLYFQELGNLAHAPAFGVHAVVTLALLRRWTTWPEGPRYAAALAFTAVAGTFVELIQPWIGRDGEIGDVVSDVSGAAAALATTALFEGLKRLLASVVLAGAIGIVLFPTVAPTLGYVDRHRQFPAILDLSSPFDRYFLRFDAVDSVVAELPRRWRRASDPPSLRIRVGTGDWPGVMHVEPSPDWSGYTSLNIDWTNPGARPLTLTLRVHDLDHDNRRDDRFNETLTLAAATRSVVSVPLERVAQGPLARRLDLERVGGINVFCGTEVRTTGQEYYLTRIWLE